MDQSRSMRDAFRARFVKLDFACLTELRGFHVRRRLF
jgi:hypothetical protein